jgi:hypothetical protein
MRAEIHYFQTCGERVLVLDDDKHAHAPILYSSKNPVQVCKNQRCSRLFEDIMNREGQTLQTGISQFKSFSRAHTGAAIHQLTQK